MKKIIILAAIALMSQACISSPDKDKDENPRRESVEYLNYEALSKAAWSAGLADFFDRYQDIRQDRDAALALGREYFGAAFHPQHLVYERYYAGIFGEIYLTETPGQYRITYSTEGPGNIVFNVETLEDRRYRITSKTIYTKDPGPQWTPFEIVLECTATITPEGIAVIENLDLGYREIAADKTTTARITSTPASAKFRLFLEHAWDRMPFEGTLDYQIGGDLINDKFSVRYSGDKYDIL